MNGKMRIFYFASMAVILISCATPRKTIDQVIAIERLPAAMRF